VKKQYQAAVSAILEAKRVVLAAHVNPDGDTLGCVLALTHLLRGLGKEAIPLSADGVPDIYRWIPGAEWVQTGTERRDFDLAIVCDAGALERVGKSVAPVVQSAPRLMDIDHHVADGPFGDIRLLNSRAAATAELVWELILAVESATGSEPATKEIAACLMVGLVTDTGSFRFPNVTPKTFLLAARLQRLGAVPAEIYELVYENKSFASLKLLGRALDALQTTADGRIAWTHVTAADFASTGAEDADTEGIVTHVRAVQGVQIGILFREVPGGKIRISLRAREGADVNKIANVFGGGGHKLAAGCSVAPPLADVEKAVLAEAVRQLTSTG
jgi:bifunctional oligoribonuclease and PAP phosphatase NrnA